MNLQIQCPKCSKRFTVHEDLTGKTVECGACDHRFPVRPGSIIAERAKVYPGEHTRDDFLSRLGRDPSTVAAAKIPAAAPRFATPHVDAIMPASAGQNIAAITGAVLLILFSLIFFLGTSEGGNFKDFDLTKRVILGIFISVLGGGLILFGSKNWRAKAIMLIVILISGLSALILIRDVEMTPAVGEFFGDQTPLTSPKVSVGLSLDDDIKTQVGYHAMERVLESMSERFEGDPSKYLVGIYIRDLESSQFHSVENYLQTSLQIPPTEGVSRYPRNGEKDSLIVISGLKLDFDTVVRACDPRLGRATTHPGLRLIELKLSALHAAKPSDDLRQKLSDPKNPGFFTANLSELGVLDPLRVQDAVAQLAQVPADVELRYRDEIGAALMGLVSRKSDPILQNDLGNALSIWAVGNQACLDIVARRVEKWIGNEREVPVSFVDYLIENNSNKSPLLVDLLWSKDPENWSGQYIALGRGAERKVLSHFEGSSTRLRNAAAFILATIGTERSLPALSKFKNSDDRELKVLVERAIQGIEAR